MIGDRTKQVSTARALAYDKAVTIDSTDTTRLSAGKPAHTPEVEAQECVDVNTGVVYKWWAGAWH
jgi:alanine-alpha-ketoisovalerate/valine-pyruvate aminotransferase